MIPERSTVSTHSDDIPEEFDVSFKPGWPSLYPLGLIVARSTVNQLELADDAEEVGDVEDVVRWTLHIAVRESAPRLAFIAELTVTNQIAFGGVTVIMPFYLRDEPDDLDIDFLNGTLEQYGEWLSGLMYDHAATVLRTALAGNGLPLFVPFGTPEAELHTIKATDSPPT